MVGLVVIKEELRNSQTTSELEIRKGRYRTAFKIMNYVETHANQK
jgi:hypothetical protein